MAWSITIPVDTIDNVRAALVETTDPGAQWFGPDQGAEAAHHAAWFDLSKTALAAAITMEEADANNTGYIVVSTIGEVPSDGSSGGYNISLSRMAPPE